MEFRKKERTERGRNERRKKGRAEKSIKGERTRKAAWRKDMFAEATIRPEEERFREAWIRGGSDNHRREESNRGLTRNRRAEVRETKRREETKWVWCLGIILFKLRQIIHSGFLQP